MSMFLGPIHYWLYGKIDKQEELTRRIAATAVNQGWINSEEDYVYELPELESAIDVGNIHGWLQSSIEYAESRYANLIEAITDNDESRLVVVNDIAYDFGKENAIAKEADASDAYKAFDDFFLNGMPCDRINNIIDNTEDIATWEMAEDIHAHCWSNNDSSRYYTIRKSVMDGMLEGTQFAVNKEGNQYSIHRV